MVGDLLECPCVAQELVLPDQIHTDVEEMDSEISLGSESGPPSITPRSGLSQGPAAPAVIGFSAGRLLVGLPQAPSEAFVPWLPVELLLNGAPVQVIDTWPAAGAERIGFELLGSAALDDQHFPWALADNDESCALGLNFSEQWSLENGSTAFIGQRPGDANQVYRAIYQDAELGRELPVCASGTYLVAGWFGLHRCDGHIEVEYLDASRDLIRVQSVPIPQGRFGGRWLKDYARVEHSLPAVAGASFLRLSVVKHAAEGDADSSMLLFTGVSLTFLPANSMLLKPGQLDPEQRTRLIRAAANNQVIVRFAMPADRRVTACDCVEVRYGAAKHSAEGSPVRIKALPALSGLIKGLNGCSLEGEIDTAIHLHPEPRLWIYLDDRLMGQVDRFEPVSGQNSRWSFPVDSSHFDGRVHVFQALTGEGVLVCEYPLVMPFSLVPWAAVERYASRPLPAALASAAAYRYGALEKNLELYAEQVSRLESEPVALRQLALQHAQLGKLHRLLVDGDPRARAGTPLTFPIHENPLVSIIIPIHNKWPITRHCLVSLLVAANRASFEVIVVDDGSSDDSVDIPSMVLNVGYVRNEQPVGFVLGCNRGASMAKGEYLVFLNNDTEPTVGWLDELLDAFKNFPDVGMAGSRLLYPDGTLQEAGGIVWNNGDPWNYGRNANPHDPRYGYTRQADYVSGAAIMLPRKLWEEIGAFSEEFVPAYFEDTDLAFKVRAAGKKVLYVPHSTVYHYEGASSGTSTASGMKRFQEVNRPKFKRKWASAYANHGVIGRDPDLEKDRGITRRALLIDVSVPRPNNDAGSYATVQEIRLLQALGFKVTFVAENLSHLGCDYDRLTRMGVETLYAPFVLSVNEVLEKRGREFDVVYVTRYYTALNHIDNVRRLAPQAKILFNNVDLHFLRQMREAASGSQLTSFRVAEETRVKELDVCRRVDVILSYSDIEHAVLEGHGIPKSKIALCPWVVEVPESVPDFASRNGVGYLGGFEHGPNRPAVMFFVEEVLPRLRSRNQQINLRVFGSGSSQALHDLKREGVVVEGYVDDVAEAYDSCRVFVAPLLTGAGIKGKVIGALAHGLPSVISPIAAEATGIRDGVEAFVVGNPEEWVDRIGKLYSDENLWNEMSSAASRLARERYGYERGKRGMKEALELAGIYANVG